MKTAIITGAGRGLGRSLLAAALPHFDRIVAVIRSPLPYPADDDRQGKAVEMIADLAQDLASVGARLHECSAVNGAREITFFDNAAVHELLLTGEPHFRDTIERTLRINVTAPAAIVSALLSVKAQTRLDLTLVHIATGASKHAIASWGPYCASKAAASMFFDVVGAENPDVRIFKIDPGALDTDMQRAIRSGPDVAVRDQFRQLQKDGRLISPDEAAERIMAEVVG